MDVGTVFTALADPTRRAIFESVRRGPRSVGDIASDFDVSRPAISQHLKVLSEAHLIRSERSGRNNFYTLDTTGLMLLRSYLESFWTDVLSAFQAHISAENEKRKKEN
jgi:DNA-binding transcriptional ArsR family regulator